MKTFIRLFIVLIIAAAAVVAVVVMHMRKTDKEKIAAETRSAVASTKDAMTDAVKAGKTAAS